MMYSKNFLIFLSLNIASLIYSASAEDSQGILYRIKTENVINYKTGLIINGIIRSEYHQAAIVDCDGKITHDPAKVIVYSREDGTPILPETTLLYPDPKIGKFLDTWHKTTPKNVVCNIRVMRHYMRFLTSESEEECRAKIAIFQILNATNPSLAETLISWEKQKDAAQGLQKKLLKIAETDSKYLPQVLKAELAADSISQKLDIAWQGLGSFRFTDREESRRAFLHGKSLVQELNKPLEASIIEAIDREKIEEAKKQAFELK